MYNYNNFEVEKTIADETALQSRLTIDQMIREPIRFLKPRQPPVCVERGENMKTALGKMDAERVGHVLITDLGRLAGIITERDIVRRVVGRSEPLEEMIVEKFMTPDPECLNINDPISFALNLMAVGEFRHIPLVDELHRPVGSLSVRRFLRWLGESLGPSIINLPPNASKPFPTGREGA